MHMKRVTFASSFILFPKYCNNGNLLKGNVYLFW